MMAIELTRHLLRRGDGKDYTDLRTYRDSGGYKRLSVAFAKGPEWVAAEVKNASLRGRGGAGFPAGVKWGFLPKDTDKPKYLVVNADEGEPGTFKDTYFLKEDPHTLLEGIIITCYALDIHACYIYIRGEFYKQIEVMEQAIKDARRAGLIGDQVAGRAFKLEVHVHTGAGAYICGEETALLESLEGKPGQPRLKPPFPAVVGLFGCPTIINNVETIAAVPLIIEHGADWWNELGVPNDGGVRLVGISGHVKKPGLYEVRVGTNLKEFIHEVGGGVLGDRAIKAVIPGGSSCPVLTPDEIDRPMTNDELKSCGSMLGTAGIIVIAEGTCLVSCLQRISAFYKHESCGQCTPCREGSGWVSRLVDRIEDGEATYADIDKLMSVANGIDGNTICAFGEATAWPVQAFLRKFRSEFEAHVEQRRCPYEGTPLPS